jgi:hypothetical protein
MRHPPEDRDGISEERLLDILLFAPDRLGNLGRGDTGSALLLPAFDADRFAERVQREGVSAVIYHNVRKHHLAGLLPQTCLSELSARYHANLRHNLLIIGALRHVLDAFHEAGIACIVLKGMVLAERIYPNLALRGMSDVDVLIRKEDLFRADAVLAARGYTSRDATAARAAENPVGYLASLEYRKSETAPLNFHLHWHLVNTSVPATAFVDRIDLDRFWEKAVVTKVADSPVWMLCPEHLLIYLCEHALRVGHSFDRLILLCDLYWVIKTFADRIDWMWVVEESRRLGLDRFVFHALTILQHHTGLTAPDPCLAELRPAALTWEERFFLRLQLNDRRVRGSSYFLYLALNRGFLAKLHLVVRTFFPPRVILRQRRPWRKGAPGEAAYSGRAWEIITQLKGVLGLFLRKKGP